MELTVALSISIISVVITVANFVLNRKDKAIKDTRENHQELIEYQLRELKEDVKAILNKIDKYESDMDDKVNKAIDIHVKLYHRGEK